MYINRSTTLLNSIIKVTSDSMSYSIYKNSLFNIGLNEINRGFTAVENKICSGDTNCIICDSSYCGCYDEKTGETCK